MAQFLRERDAQGSLLTASIWVGRDVFRTRLRARFTHVDGHLSSNEYLMGRDYSVADAHFFVVSNWASWLDFDLSPYRAVLAHRERVGSRPAVVAALKTEGLVPSGHVATLTPDIPTTDTDQGTKSLYLPSRMTAFLLSNRMLYRAT